MNETLQITESAFTHIATWIAKESGAALHIGLKQAGCSGLQYVTDILESDPQTESQSKYQVIELGSARDPQAKIIIAVDSDSWQHIKGSVIDFVKQGLQERLIFRNPNEAGSCGCGESFTV